MNWISTKEQLPEFKDNSDIVFVIGATNNDFFAKKLYFHRTAKDMNQLWFDPEGRKWLDNSSVTYWMPLPDMPNKTPKDAD